MKLALKVDIVSSTTVLFVFLLVTIFNTNVVRGQSSDRIKYYILYDKSGSVTTIDKNQNLLKLMSNLIELGKTSVKSTSSKVGDPVINSASSFELFPFGADTSLTKKQTVEYDPFSNAVGNSKSLIDKITNITNYKQNKKQIFSNIHTALALLLQSIDSSQAAGIFIFTDGVLSQKDYSISKGSLKDSIKNVQDYYRYVDELMNSIRLKTNKPIFLIQTSNKPVNPYYSGIGNLATKQKLPKDSLVLINDSTVFWLKDTVKYSSGNKNDKNSQAFADFVARANDMIVRSEPQFGESTNSVIDKSVIINNIGEANALAKTNLSADLSYVLNILDSTKVSLDVDGKRNGKLLLDSLISKAPLKITAVEVQRIKDYIAKVDIRQLQATLDAAQKQLAAKGNLAKSSLMNFINISANSKVFSPATLTSTSLVSQTSGVKSLEQDAILAVADYIIDRAKQEAVFTFMENFNDKIVKSNLPLQQMFPEMTEILKNPDNYHDMSLWKETFRRDLNQLPDNIEQSGLFKTNLELTGIVAMIRLFKNVNENPNIEVAFQLLNENLAKLQLPDSRIVHALQFTSNVIGYLTTNDLATVYQDKPKLERLSRLIVILSLDKNTLEHIDSLDLNNSAEIVRNIFLQYRLISNQIAEFTKDVKPSADFDGYRQLRQDAVVDILSRCSDLLFSGYNVLNSLHYRGEVLDQRYKDKQVLKNFNRAKEGYFLIKSKDYTQAALLLAPVIMETIYSREVLKRIDSCLLTEDALESAYKLYARQKEVATKIMYIAAEVSEAESAESIKKIIGKYALPVASYRIKHTSSPNLMIGSYLGLGGAYFVKTDQAKASYAPILSAPIGLDWSFKWSAACTSSFSVFASIIDVGNVVSYRLWNRNNALEDDVVQLKNIVSPGLYLTWSPSKKVPLSLNGGYGFNPGRFSLSINFDMPLFALYRNKSN